MTTPNKTLNTPSNGSNINTWDVPVNANFNAIDTALGGVANINAVSASGTVTLTLAQYTPPNIIISGALTANVNYQIPSGVGGVWSVWNNTSGAYTITISSAAGGSTVIVPQGIRNQVVSDGTSNGVALTTTQIASAGGSNTQVQYNNGGVLAGSALTYNNSTGGFSIAAPSSGTALTVNVPLSVAGVNLLGAANSSLALSTSSANAAARNWGMVANITAYGDWALQQSNALGGDPIAAGTQAIYVSAARNVTVNAPSSGASLTANSPYGTRYAFVAVGSTASGGDGTGYRMVDGNAGNRVWDMGVSLYTGTGIWELRDSTRAATVLFANSTGNVQINAPSSGVAATINGLSTGVDTVLFKASANSAQGQISFAVPAGTVGSLLWDNGTSLTGYANSVAFGGPAAAVSLQTSNANRVLVNGTGNVTINAPSSGTTLALTSVGSGVALALAGAASNAVQVLLTDGQTGNKQWVLVNGALSTPGLFGLYNGSTSTYALTASATGNLTINAPSSGTALAITGLSSQYAWSATDGISTSALYLNGASGSQIGTYSNHAFSLWSNNAARVAIAAAGNVTINPPTSGVALTVTPASGGVAAALGYIQIQNDNGFVASGGNLYTTSTTPFYFGTGGGAASAWYTNSAARIAVASAGNVTINAPTSGQALNITAATGGLSNAGLIVNGSASTPISAVTFSATAMSIDCTRSNVFITTLTANVTTAPVYPNPQDGQTINWFILQDATGTRTMTWGAAVKWPGGTAGILSTAANAVDLLVMTYRSATNFWYATLSKGFA